MMTYRQSGAMSNPPHTSCIPVISGTRPLIGHVHVRSYKAWHVEWSGTWRSDAVQFGSSSKCRWNMTAAVRRRRVRSFGECGSVRPCNNAAGQSGDRLRFLIRQAVHVLYVLPHPLCAAASLCPLPGNAGRHTGTIARSSLYAGTVASSWQARGCRSGCGAP